MSEWIRVDTDWPEHRRLESANAGDVAFWFACLAYCGRNETDGYLSRTAIKSVSFYTPTRVKRLCAFGLLSIGDPQGYWMHDYLDHQDSKSALVAKREAWRVRAQRHRHGVSHGVTDDSRHGVSHARTQQDPISTTTVVEGPRSEAPKLDKNGGEIKKKEERRAIDMLPYPMRERWVSDRVLHTFQPADVPMLIASWEAANDLRDYGQRIEDAGNPRSYAMAIAARSAPSSEVHRWERKLA